MKSLDKLRSFAADPLLGVVSQRQHAETINAIADAIEAELAERYVALPLDVEGEPVHVGDVMEFSEFEIEHPVTRTVEGIGQGTFFAWCGERGYQQHDPKRYRHHRPPTVEDVLRELVAAYMGTPLDDSNDGEFFAEYAAKLRLAGEE
ncbi:MAG: hypothetical protein IJG82_09370 [Atopobiaceae bacterium]|nr:hypothetical protein [Atopobiaceae bacterium]